MPQPEVKFFADKFHETIDDAREKSLFSQQLDSLMAYPVLIEPVEISDDFLGALWIPPMQIQSQLGPVEHWRGTTAFYEVGAEFNKIFSETRNLRLGNYRGYLWLINIDTNSIEFNCHNDPFPIGGIKQQVTSDFGITIKVG